MAKARAPKAIKKPKGITPEFEETLNVLDEAGLKSLVVTIQNQLEEVQSFLKGEDDTEASRELLRVRHDLAELTGPANETKKVLSNRTKAILKTLTERGHL
jgi:hypothetical protein